MFDYQREKDRAQILQAAVLSVLSEHVGAENAIKAADLALMAYCGLRTVEVRRANLGHLGTRGDRLVLAVQGKGRREADEIVVIPHRAEPLLHAWVKVRSRLGACGEGAALFVSLSNRSHGRRLSSRAIRAMVKKRYREAGVVGPRKSTHSLRHSAVTAAIRGGATPMQVQAMARHASFDTTLGYFHEESRTANPAEDLIDYGEV
jgi:site-specific recombinase XerD